MNTKKTSDAAKERRGLWRRLIGEVKRLVEVLRVNWADAEPARPVRATEVIGLAADLYATYRRSGTPDTHEVAEVAALEADGADKAGRIADGGSNTAQGVDGGTADGNAAESVADREAALRREETCLAGFLFAHDAAELVLDCYKLVLDGGAFAFEYGDPVAAEKRAEALERLLSRIEEIEDGHAVGDEAHSAIIAYLEARDAIPAVDRELTMKESCELSGIDYASRCKKG